MPTIRDVTVLVVDDSATMRTILRDMLQNLGARSVEEAESGEDAVRKLRSRNYALVICDWNMGETSGLDVLREVRRLRPRDASRFIFVTSERSYGHQTSAKVDGADAFLSKPFTLAALKGKIEQVLGR